MNLLNPEIVTTKDGSTTIKRSDINECYHSVHGALQESQHVFIESGLDIISSSLRSIKIFEMGFGTGLNALLTLKWAKEHKLQIEYITVENHPLTLEIASKMNYTDKDALKNYSSDFIQLHDAAWDAQENINQTFSITKLRTNLRELTIDDKFDLVYYDAFSPDRQPELWTIDIFKKLYSMMMSEGVLTTYCAKGYVRRNMQAAGFEVERIPGPPGKREMLRATRLD